MKQQKAFALKNRGKFSCFACHRYFLSRSHAFRRNTIVFLKGKTITRIPLTAYLGTKFMLR